METAMERLSSGKRINSAMDDAAGLSISHSLNSKITSMNQATRNANDGIAMVNLAEGAMDQITQMLTRMKELATQSANGIYNDSTDRANLNAEFVALKDEITRISNVTTYNGINVLNTQSTVNFQVGELSTDTVSATFKDMKSSAIGSGSVTQTGVPTYTLTSGATKVVVDDDVYDTGGNQPHAAEDSVTDVAAAAGTAQRSGFYVGTDIDFSQGDEVMRITIAGQTFTQEAVDAGSQPAETDATLTALASQINAAGLGVNATLQASVTDGTKDTLVLTASANNTPFSVSNLGIYTVASGNTTINTATVENSNVSSDTNAVSAMLSIDKAIEQVDTYRSELGAVANRMEHTVGNLMTRAQHTSAAMSRIMDADYATESANLAKAQVLQQAGTAMLAQANASTQNVLSLLK
jgi:flagellin